MLPMLRGRLPVRPTAMQVCLLPSFPSATITKGCPSKSAQLPRQLVVRAKGTNADSVSSRQLEHLGKLTRSKDRPPILQRGDFLINRALGCRSVVLRVDERCKQDNKWCHSEGISEVTKNQPFYLCLGDERDTAQDPALFYVPHEYVVPYTSNSPLQNKWASYFFRGFADGKHQIKNNMVVSLS